VQIYRSSSEEIHVFSEDHNKFEAECVVCIPEWFLSVANKRPLDLEAYLETKHAKIV
jgi:hypothetical protein